MSEPFDEYQQARADFEALEKLSPVKDWTGAENEFREFLENPRPAFAARLYRNLIDRWGVEHKGEVDPPPEISARYSLPSIMGAREEFQQKCFDEYEREN